MGLPNSPVISVFLFSLGPLKYRAVGKDRQTLFCETGLPQISQRSPLFEYSQFSIL